MNIRALHKSRKEGTYNLENFHSAEWLHVDFLFYWNTDWNIKFTISVIKNQNKNIQNEKVIGHFFFSWKIDCQSNFLRFVLLLEHSKLEMLLRKEF